jgi:hypothetical protein
MNARGSRCARGTERKGTRKGDERAYLLIGPLTESRLIDASQWLSLGLGPIASSRPPYSTTREVTPCDM